jgi:hypothetical protein
MYHRFLNRLWRWSIRKRFPTTSWMPFFVKGLFRFMWYLPFLAVVWGILNRGGNIFDGITPCFAFPLHNALHRKRGLGYPGPSCWLRCTRQKGQFCTGWIVNPSIFFDVNFVAKRSGKTKLYCKQVQTFLANPDRNEFFSQKQVDSLRAKNFRVLG